jgi:Tfp pilus assembly protein PilN
MMKQINLLPKVPWLKRWFMTMLVSAIGLFLIVNTGLGLLSIRIKNADQSLADEVAAVRSRVALMQQQRVIDPATKEYQELLKEVEKLKGSRPDWPAIMEQMREGLPQSARMNKASLKENAVELENDFYDLGNVAGYLDYLNKLGLFDTISIKSIDSIELTAENQSNSTAVPSSLRVNPSTVVTSSPNTQNGEKEVTAEQLIESFQKDNPPAQDEAAQLMNELNWLVTGQAYKDQFGIDLPKPDEANRKSPPPGSPFTEREWQSALDEVEQLKKMRVTTGDRSGATENPDAAEPPPIMVYRVALQVTMKAPNTEKQG